MARRLYLGRLPPDARSDDVAKFFDGYGRIIDCRVMTGSSDKRRASNAELTGPPSGFGFVEFESSKDAEDAVHHFNGKPFMGANIVVEFAKESRPRRDVYESDRGYGAARSRRPPGIRLIVSGISRDTSWQCSRSIWRFRFLEIDPAGHFATLKDRQYFVDVHFRRLCPNPTTNLTILLTQDLKDFGREAGSVSFADIDRDNPGQGILEYLSRDDADRAVKDLDGKDLRGRPVRVAYDDARGGPDNYRREDRREERPRSDDRYKEERYYRDDRSSYRRERSRSPPRRNDYDDRRPRSPPPPRRDPDERKPAGYDDYRRGGYDDDRRAPDYYYDRRRDDDRRREDRGGRRDEKDDRYDDRAMRHANGDGGWAR
ncbi:hypothetical protein DFJ58DRAFT_720465 [Suillus subalutaceus]|uniref:uncharacterized protein n=1 Tax=Suillus subalutaceus TaxID=48586 RepID=UPI001B85DAF8|nr:uncharacterized protein DFJ58DRAFT_720465 [Suillus subalutaceus]KAG1877680.1 hypothetical protein DFJ58DRAFT_720465 [Suillus subalutaceus]